MNEKQREAILEYLNDCNDEEILSIVRDINGYNGECENLEWFDMEYEFDELCGGMKPWDIARACYYGDFNPAHDYWPYDGYGNFESTDYLDYDESDKEDIIDAIEHIPYGYLSDDIQNILDENEENDEESEGED